MNGVRSICAEKKEGGGYGAITTQPQRNYICKLSYPNREQNLLCNFEIPKFSRFSDARHEFASKRSRGTQRNAINRVRKLTDLKPTGNLSHRM